MTSKKIQKNILSVGSNWQCHMFSYKDRLVYALKEGLWSDCSFTIGMDANGEETSKTKTFFAHKFVLACASPVFAKILFCNATKKNVKPIRIADIEPEIFSMMLKYIYTDEIEFESWEEAAALSYAAKQFMLRPLHHFCIDYIVKILKSSNALLIFEFAKSHREPKLMDAALQIIREETLLVFETPEFIKIDISMMMLILEQNELQATEMELFDALEDLAKYQGVIPTSTFDNDENEKNALPVGDNGNKLMAEFRKAVKKINFLCMTAEQFANGPALSKLLLPEEAMAITTCLITPNYTERIYPKNFVQNRRVKCLPRAFLDLTIGGAQIGRIVIELRSDIVPKTVKNFLSLCSERKSYGYKGSYFCRIFDNNFCQGQAIKYSNGINYLGFFNEPENFILKHKVPGIISMPMLVQKTTETVFSITLNKNASFDDRCVAFGLIVEGMNVFKEIMSYSTEKGVPSKQIKIENCGELNFF